MLNPFITSGYAGPKYFCDREKETGTIVRLLQNGNNVALISPRRFGKTDLIRHCFEQAEIKEKRERMQEGNPAPEFTFQNLKGKETKLSKFKGKVLVLDFWASWCGPCRQEIPNMKKYYEEFKDKGVEFLSVSIDAKKDAWTKALGEEKMAWQQGCVTDAGKSVMNTYQFGGIPFIILIDKDGKIYKKNLRGEKIKEAIEDCLAGKKPTAPKVMMGMGMMGAM